MLDSKQTEFISENAHTLFNKDCLLSDDSSEERDTLLKTLSPWYNSALPVEVQNASEKK